MSLHITLLDNRTGKGKLYAITDKRSMLVEAKTGGGEFTDWKHDHDNCVKLYQVNDSVYGIAIGVGKVGHYDGGYFQKEILKYKSLKPSEIIKHAKSISRVITPQFGPDPQDTAIIFGKHENGDLFEWCGARDGSERIHLIKPGDFNILCQGGSMGTQEKTGMYFYNLFKQNVSIKKALIQALQYASKIDERQCVSPTYDFITKQF